MTKLVLAFAGHAVPGRFVVNEEDLWMGIIGVMACAAGLAAGFALAAFI